MIGKTISVFGIVEKLAVCGVGVAYTPMENLQSLSAQE
jgi:hypothetical protein